MPVVMNGVVSHVRFTEMDEVDERNPSEIETEQEQIAAEA